MKEQNELIRKAKLKEIRKTMETIEKTENKIRRLKKVADFDSRYSKTGQLSDNCCKFDDLKIDLLTLKARLKQLEMIR